MPKVLIFINHSLALYKFRRELPEKLLANNYDVVLCYPNSDKDDYFKQIGCKVIHIPMERKSKNLFSEMMNIRFFKKICKLEKPDVLLTYTIKCCLYGSYVSKSIKKIATVTGQSSFFKNASGIRGIVYRHIVKSFKKYNYIFFQNSDDFNRYAKILKSKTDNFVLVPGSGVNLDSHPYQKNISNDPFVFSFIGRLVKEKGIYEFLDAVKNINDESTIFNIAGPCEDNSILNAINNANDRRIVYLGDVENINALYRRSTCIVVPSYSEGMCNALQEAQASGRPVIASDIPGCKETFVHGESGLAITPRDSNSLLEAMMIMKSKTIQEIKQMGIKGCQHVSNNFNREKVIDEYVSKIERLTLNINQTK